jgi:predicted enzyme related to lactoylglutathione lyase
MVYFAVEDVDAAAKRVEELGGKVAVPPTDTPAGRFAVVNDPQGAVFSIIALAARADGEDASGDGASES